MRRTFYSGIENYQVRCSLDAMHQIPSIRCLLPAALRSRHGVTASSSIHLNHLRLLTALLPRHAIERLALWAILDKENYGDPVDNKLVVRVVHDEQEALDTLISVRTISSYQNLSSGDLWECSEKKDFEILHALEENDIDAIIEAVENDP